MKNSNLLGRPPGEIPFPANIIARFYENYQIKVDLGEPSTAQDFDQKWTDAFIFRTVVVNIKIGILTFRSKPKVGKRKLRK